MIDLGITVVSECVKKLCSTWHLWFRLYVGPITCVWEDATEPWFTHGDVVVES